MMREMFRRSNFFINFQKTTSILMLPSQRGEVCRSTFQLAPKLISLVHKLNVVVSINYRPGSTALIQIFLSTVKITRSMALRLVILYGFDNCSLGCPGTMFLRFGVLRIILKSDLLSIKTDSIIKGMAFIKIHYLLRAFNVMVKA